MNLPTRLGAATRNAHLWLPGYLLSRLRARKRMPATDVWMMFADHFEPLWASADGATARARVARWRQVWPEIASRHRDSEDRPPCYGFFYPEEEYRPELLEPLAEMARLGIADVEVHLHHDRDTEPAFRERLGRFLEALNRDHGLLRVEDGRKRFGFIHGNWCLDNARPDGRWCGLDNEITILREMGCYADFTLPAAPDPSQTGPVNVIYRATDDPHRPRSHARGTPVEPGARAAGDLTLIPGPLGLDWTDRTLLKPRLDTGEVAANHRPSPERTRLWLDVAPRIGSHVFVKLFSHGAPERNSEVLLGGDLDRLFESVLSESRARGLRLHYVSPWEMWQAIERFEDAGSPIRSTLVA
jgi:hypothetical protein